jgi:hypothetical protein
VAFGNVAWSSLLADRSEIAEFAGETVQQQKVQIRLGAIGA